MSKNLNLQQLMILGMVGGALFSRPCSAADEKGTKVPSLLSAAEATNGNITYHLMTADELKLELTDDGAKQFDALSPEGQQLALKIASRSCDGTNDCKGQNACQTKENKCAGQGKCKGLTKCAFSDKILAVQVAAKIMAEKRKDLQKK